MIKKIESAKNDIIKYTKKLISKSGRQKSGEFIIEGERLVCDAIKNGADISYILIKSGVDFDVDDLTVFELSEKAYAEVKDTVNSQGIIAVVKSNENTFDKSSAVGKEFILYLDRVMDPGNMGTIIRTADAAGVDAVVLSMGCVDIYNPKVVRSTMASIFNVPVYTDDGNSFEYLKSHGFAVFAASLDTDKSCFDVDFTGKTVIVIGNEANGISDEVLSKSDVKIKIPILGKAESLNASVAGAVLMYERVRQTTL